MWIHLTQACDFARIDVGSLQKLLLLEGEAQLESSNSDLKDRGAEVSVRGCRVMDQTYVLHLDLRRVQMVAPSLAVKLLTRKRYRVSGRMRADAAQRLLNQYAQHISRVAMPGETAVRPIVARLVRKHEGNWMLYSVAGDAVPFSGALTGHDDHKQIAFFEPSASEMAAAAEPGVQALEGAMAPQPPALTWLEYLVSCFRNGINITGGGSAKLAATKAVTIQPESDETFADAAKWAKDRGGRVIVLYRTRDDDT